MDYGREPMMPLKNRPDERKREEAKLARANQARPLADPPHRDSAFSRVPVHAQRPDILTRKINDLLGPYHKVLSGASANGLRARSGLMEKANNNKGETKPEGPSAAENKASRKSLTSCGGGEDDSVDGSVSSNTDASVVPCSVQSNSVKGVAASLQTKPDVAQPSVHHLQRQQGSAAGHNKTAQDAKHSSSLYLTQSSTAPRVTKTALLSTPPEKLKLSLANHPTTLQSASSPAAPHSPYKDEDVPNALKDSSTTTGTDSGSQKSSAISLPPFHMTKSKTSMPSQSPSKDGKSQHHQHAHQALTKLKSEQRSSSTLATEAPVSLSSCKEHNRIKSPSPASSHPLQSVTGASSVATNQCNRLQISTAKKQTSPALPSLPSSQSHKAPVSASPNVSSTTYTMHKNPVVTSSPTSGTSQSASSCRQHKTSPLIQRPPTTTPTKTGPHLPNGLAMQHSKLPLPSSASSAIPLISSVPSCSTDTSTVNSAEPVNSASATAEKTKSLKLLMPSENKLASKSDLNDIFKEMEVQPLHTAIQTPHKVRDSFPFSTGGTSFGQQQQQQPTTTLPAAATTSTTTTTITTTTTTLVADSANRQLPGETKPDPRLPTLDKVEACKEDIVKSKGKKEENSRIPTPPPPAPPAAAARLNSPGARKASPVAVKPSPVRKASPGPHGGGGGGGGGGDPVQTAVAKPRSAGLKAGKGKDMSKPTPASSTTTTTTTTTTPTPDQSKLTTSPTNTSITTSATTTTTTTTTTPTPDQSAVLDSSGHKGLASVRSLGKAISDSILMRDLDLSSEDSDADQAFEDNKTSASQSKKGKVMDTASKRPPSRLSSSGSSNSSSDVSSESVGEDDDDDADKKKEDDKEKMEAKPDVEERQPSTSSSSSSSDSSSESGSDEDEEDEKKKEKESKTMTERGEKSSSPQSKSGVPVPASIGTPGLVQENSESSVSWRLDLFLPSKKNSNSPASTSSMKLSSPPSGSLIPLEGTRSSEESARPRTLKDIGPCTTMPFDVCGAKDSEGENNDYESDNEKADVDSDMELDEVFQKKLAKKGQRSSSHSVSKVLSSPSDSKSSLQGSTGLSRTSGECVRTKAELKTGTQGKKDPDLHGKCTVPTVGTPPNSSNKLKTKSPSSFSKHKKSKSSTSTLGKSVSAGLSSDDEIDVVTFTPDEKQSQMRSPDCRQKQEATRTLFNGDLSLSEEENSNASVDRGKNVPSLQKKHHRRKRPEKGNPLSFNSRTPHTPPQQGPAGSLASNPSNHAPKVSCIDSTTALNHLESISRPPNLLSPLHSACSPTPGTSSVKPLPSFQTSFSPAPASQSSASTPPIVTLSRGDDGTRKPCILLHIRKEFLSERSLLLLRERKERRKNSGKAVKDVAKPVQEVTPDKEAELSSSSKENRVPPISSALSPLSTSSIRDISTSSLLCSPTRTLTSSPQHSSPPSATSRTSKRKSHEAGDSSSIIPITASSSSSLTSLSQLKSRKSAKSISTASSSSSSKEESSSHLAPPSSSSSLSLEPPAAAAVVPPAAPARVDPPDRTAQEEQESSPPPNLPRGKLKGGVGGTGSAVKSLRDFSPEAPPPGHRKATTTTTTTTTSTANAGSTSGQVDGNGSSGGATKPSKRRMDPEDELSQSTSSVLKKVKAEVAIVPSSKQDGDTKPLDSSTGTHPAARVGKHRRDSTSSGSSQKTASSFKKSRHSSNTSNNSSSNTSKTSAKTEQQTHNSSGPSSENSNLPFNLYVNGNDSACSKGPPASTSTANLPSPTPIITQLQSIEHYMARAKEHKHHADNKKDKLAYLRSCLSFYLAGCSMEQSRREPNNIYKMYNETANLLLFAISMRASSSSTPESADRERKLIVLIIRLQSFLNHRLYRLKKTEVNKLRKVIESEQGKIQSNSASVGSSSGVPAKPHAPSPHQGNWNKNSTGTPSPMSPTPSPAGSVSSQGSCELVTGKIPNGTTTSASSTPMTSPSPGMVSVHQRLHNVYQKYSLLTGHLVKAMELWDQADAECRGQEEFFNILDNACGPLSFHSEPLVVVRYMKHALRLLTM